ncbi:TIGR03752 family integrating conjugative element protein [Pseudomonas sp. MSSRFD41]|uniref:TIGR03752 family integrating conjugative element protein n=1 Tax=Pseudomonas sp. MSSRFD41 TaxID=1310370 RepID=UPI00163A6874|nr:TIGR03752 family integrating conjugative element protein [Pseudomonas sp. MSSRFD41]MBC2659075.1 TIGR03752 family integrating conjugative element protein [Pseudomonas sp. MSSRFD41]
MSIQSNPLLKWLAVPFLVFAVVMFFTATKKGQVDHQENNVVAIGSGEAQKLGVDGDTPGDTLRTVVTESKELRKQVADLLKINNDQKSQNEELQKQLKDMDSKVESRLDNAKKELQDEVQNKSQGLIDSLQTQLNNLSNQPNATGGDLPIGFGVQPGDGKGFEQSPTTKDGLVWIEPRDATAVDANGKPLPLGSSQAASGFNFPTSFGPAANRGQNALEQIDQGLRPGNQQVDRETRKFVRKTYTLPQNSTLMGSVAMSALIGRVPIDGTVNDPFPFKILIGPDNLTANGIELSNVAGAVATGTASGDWTLSCVRGQIRSLTFVFNDGTVRTFPAPAEDADGNQNNNQASSTDGKTIQGGLGWISDSYGIPCISGDRRSNAAEYLTNQSLVTAAGAGVAKLLKADERNNTTMFTGNGTSFGTTGSSGNSAIGSILSGGVSDIRSWMNKLYGEAFAAVYVQPGAKVAVHLDQQLAIDYELKGRKVDYHSGANNVPAALD